MGVNPAPFARSDGQEELEPGEGTEVADFGFLEIPAAGGILKKCLLNVETQAVFLEGMQVVGSSLTMVQNSPFSRLVVSRIWLHTSPNVCKVRLV